MTQPNSPFDFEAVQEICSDIFCLEGPFPDLDPRRAGLLREKIERCRGALAPAAGAEGEAAPQAILSEMLRSIEQLFKRWAFERDQYYSEMINYYKGSYFDEDGSAYIVEADGPALPSHRPSTITAEEAKKLWALAKQLESNFKNMHSLRILNKNDSHIWDKISVRKDADDGHVVFIDHVQYSITYSEFLYLRGLIEARGGWVVYEEIKGLQSTKIGRVRKGLPEAVRVHIKSQKGHNGGSRLVD